MVVEEVEDEVGGADGAEEDAAEEGEDEGPGEGGGKGFEPATAEEAHGFAGGDAADGADHGVEDAGDEGHGAAGDAGDDADDAHADADEEGFEVFKGEFHASGQSWAARSRSLNFWILPLAVRGKWSVKWMYLGILYQAILLWQ